MFDLRVEPNAGVRKIDDPPSSFFGPRTATETRRDEGDSRGRLVKPWSTGGVWSIGYDPATG